MDAALLSELVSALGISRADALLITDLVRQANARASDAIERVADLAPRVDQKLVIAILAAAAVPLSLQHHLRSKAVGHKGALIIERILRSAVAEFPPEEQG